MARATAPDRPRTFDHRAIESKWQTRWEADRLYEAEADPSRPKHYALVMFPYTSGDLHLGHWWNFALADIHARAKRMQGYNVLFPPGFDAFGLPAEGARQLVPQPRRAGQRAGPQRPLLALQRARLAA